MALEQIDIDRLNYVTDQALRPMAELLRAWIPRVADLNLTMASFDGLFHGLTSAEPVPMSRPDASSLAPLYLGTLHTFAHDLVALQAALAAMDANMRQALCVQPFSL
jgi:hypothetical protein